MPSHKKKLSSTLNLGVTSVSDGVRIGSSNSIESLMENDFKLTINDNEYLVKVPKVERLTQVSYAKKSWTIV